VASLGVLARISWVLGDLPVAGVDKRNGGVKTLIEGELKRVPVVDLASLAESR
jgi:hypothetical protein